MDSQPHDWLVVFLLHSDLNLDVKNKDVKGYIPAQLQKDTLFHALSDHVANDNIKIIVIENRIEKLSKQEPEIVNRTFIMEKAGKKLRSYYKTNVKDFDVTKGPSVKKLLADVLIKEKARRRMVVTWGHGNILGLFLTEEIVQNIRSNISELLKNTAPAKKRSNGLVKGKPIKANLYRKCRSNLMSQPKQLLDFLASFEVLTGKELADALKGGLDEGEKIDVLVMDNCLMQNVCIQSEMKDAVRFLVAAQSGISYPGFNYSAILNFLNTADAENVDLVILEIMETIRSNKKFGEIPELLTELEATWSIHAKELVNFKSFEETFTEFIRRLTQHAQFKIIVRYLRDTLDNCFHYNKFCLRGNSIIDIKVVLFYFREKIKGIAEYLEIVSAIEDCLGAIDAIEGPGLLGSELFNSDYTFCDTLNNFDMISGIGILFPANENEIDEKRKEFLHNPELQPAFFINTGFIDLLQKMKVIN